MTYLALALAAVGATLLAMLPPALEYARDEWAIRTPELDMPNALRVAAIAVGVAAMLLLVLVHALRTVTLRQLLGAVAVVGALALGTELVQLARLPFQRSTLTDLTIGSTFDFWDLLAYAVGLLLAVFVEIHLIEDKKAAPGRD